MKCRPASTSIFILFFILVTVLSSYQLKDVSEGCQKGDIHYSVATYKDEFFIGEKYQIFFDSLLYKPVLNCFCYDKIINLPRRGKKSSTIIEPLVIDLNSKDGLYACRVYQKARPNPRFRCGYFHFLFIVADKHYYPLSDDSLKNFDLIDKNLSKTFTQNDLNEIKQFANDNVYCDDYTFLPPHLIKKGDSVLFDLHKPGID